LAETGERVASAGSREWVQGKHKREALVPPYMSKQGRDTELTLSDVTAVFEARDDYAEPLTASEVADELGCSRRTALNKLHDLEEETDLTSKKAGGRSRVWWIPVQV
jgi:MarR-like DNA-binding transcriptional regulator SgrR of sgrS sRNA